MTGRTGSRSPEPNAPARQSSLGKTFPIAGWRQVTRAVGRAMGGHWWALAGVVLLLTAGAAAGLVAPTALGRIVDAVDADRPDAAALWWWGGAMLLAALVGAAVTAVGVVSASRLYETVIARLREQLVSRAFQLPQAVVEAAGSGDLVSRATDDVAKISEAAPRVVPALTRSLFTVAVTMVGIAVVDPWYAVAIVAILPVHILAVRWYLRNAPGVYAEQRAAMAERAHHLLTSLRGLDTVHAYRLQDRHNARIATASWAVVRWELLARIVQNRFFARLNVAEYVGMTALLVTGYLLVTNDLGTLGAATTAILFFIRLFDPINILLIVIDDLQSALASLARIVGVIDLPEPPAPTRTEPGRDSGTGTPPLLELRGVGFGYEPERTVLEDVDIAIHPGETVALVGASGAGKTTVAAIAAGILEPTVGMVCTSAALRDQTHGIVLITQDTHVFSGTLRDNLTLVAPAATDEQITSAVRTVGASTLIERLPAGLDTAVGTDGHPLTPAETQLLALARLTLADPAIAILDEATAEAGSTHAGQLEHAMTAALADRAGLVVAHRLDQARGCDRILVIDDGRVIEQGSHDSLLASGGPYATLWRAWTDGLTPTRP